MKLPKHILLTAFAWLLISAVPAQASTTYFSCPAGEVCSYVKTGPGSVTSAQVTPLLNGGDITGGSAAIPQNFDPLNGLSLAAPASSLDPVGIITAVMDAPIYQSLFIITDELTSPTTLDERMEVLVSTNGVDFVSLGEKFNYNANDPLALIDLSGIASLLNPVTHVQIKGIQSSFAGPGCTPPFIGACDPVFENEMEVLAIAGITAPVSNVPLPAAFWLLGSGLIGLFATGRRRS